ncbi:MAG: hypothetical protein MUF00_05075 [Gemmatimonadaceae bacterium]|jgi:hypothetical protein|nr:hypothetical protein [Gemmatimonadaceae bacterium]
MAEQRAVPPVDEGLVHEWLDGQLDAARGAAIERYVAEDAAWAAALAEARGLLAATRRITRALDEVPGQVIPEPVTELAVARARESAPLDLTAARAARASASPDALPAAVAAAGASPTTRRTPRPRMSWWTWRNAAAVVLVAGGSAMVMRITRQEPLLTASSPSAVVAPTVVVPEAGAPRVPTLDAAPMRTADAAPNTMTSVRTQPNDAVSADQSLAAPAPRGIALERSTAAGAAREGPTVGAASRSSSPPAAGAAMAAPAPPAKPEAPSRVALEATPAPDASRAANVAVAAPAADSSPSAGAGRRRSAVARLEQSVVTSAADANRAEREVAETAGNSQPSAKAARNAQPPVPMPTAPGRVSAERRMPVSGDERRPDASIADVGTRCVTVQIAPPLAAWPHTVVLYADPNTPERGGAGVAFAPTPPDGAPPELTVTWRRDRERIVIAPLPSIGTLRLSATEAESNGSRSTVRWVTCPSRR